MIFLQVQVSKIVHITRNKWYRLTETDLEQVGDLDSNIHQSCCQRLCTLNQPVCNNEWEHTVTIVELSYNLLQHLLFHHALFCKCFSYVLLSTPLQLHSSVQHKKHTQYTVNDECMKREYNHATHSSYWLPPLDADNFANHTKSTYGRQYHALHWDWEWGIL